MANGEGRGVARTACAGRQGGVVASSTASPPLVRFEAVSKRFGGVAAVDALSLDIASGEFFALLGPSGCGKTTLLRLLAGFETADAGRVLLDGEDIGAVPPYRRPVNMMFQSYALFPHLSVHGNVAFGLKQEGMARRDIEARVAEMLSLVRLEGYAHRRPEQLSGGQRQRVALARSLAKRPKVLLLDEPMAALDRKLRQDTQFELMELQAKLGTTFVIVTHDQDEAMTVADRIAVMDRGRIVQVGPPQDIYEQPVSRYVAGFIGDVNLIEGRLVSTGPEGSVVDTQAGIPLRLARRVEADPGATLWIALRPEKVRLATAPATPAAGDGVDATVSEVGYLGNISIYKVRLDSGLTMKVAVANVSRHGPATIGARQRVRLSWDPDAAVVLTR
jgi:putrescine transport system ATP-binding protein